MFPLRVFFMNVFCANILLCKSGSHFLRCQVFRFVQNITDCAEKDNTRWRPVHWNVWIESNFERSLHYKLHVIFLLDICLIFACILIIDPICFDLYIFCYTIRVSVKADYLYYHRILMSISRSCKLVNVDGMDHFKWLMRSTSDYRLHEIVQCGVSFPFWNVSRYGPLRIVHCLLLQPDKLPGSLLLPSALYKADSGELASPLLLVSFLKISWYLLQGLVPCFGHPRIDEANWEDGHDKVKAEDNRQGEDADSVEEGDGDEDVGRPVDCLTKAHSTALWSEWENFWGKLDSYI